MSRSAAHAVIWFCIPLLIGNATLLLLPGEEEKRDISAEIQQIDPVLSHLPIPAPEIELATIEADLSLIDRHEWELTQWLAEMHDEVKRECVRQEVRFLNALLIRCREELRSIEHIAESMRTMDQIQQKLRSRISAINNLKEELLLLDFGCEELEEEIGPGELERIRENALQRSTHTPRHYRRPSSLPHQLA